MKFMHQFFTLLFLFFIFNIKSSTAGYDKTSNSMTVKSFRELFKVENDIPSNSFKAFYFDRTVQEPVPVSEILRNLTIQGDQGGRVYKGIDAKKFAAYWVGNFEFKEHTKRTFYFDRNDYEILRLFINGEQFPSENLPFRGDEITYTFSPGNYLIEVEFINHWHTVDFSMSIDKANKFGYSKDLIAFFERFEDKDYTIQMAGVYQSKNTDNSIDIILEDSNRPVILWLSSHRAVEWKIKNSGSLLGIIISGSSKAAFISNVASTVPVIHYAENGRTFQEPLLRKCVCIGGGRPSCNQPKDILHFSEELQERFGKEIYSFDLSYNSHELRPYTNRIDDQFISRAMEARKAQEASKAQCR